MFVESPDIAVLVAALVVVAWGSVWYSPGLFGGFKVFAIRGEDHLNTSMLTGTLCALLATTACLFFVRELVALSLTESGFSLRIAGAPLMLVLALFYGYSIFAKISIKEYMFHSIFFLSAYIGGTCIMLFWPWQ